MPPTSKAPPRPRQASFAGWVIVIGSVLVVVSAFERVAGLSSIESQEAIRDFLDDPPADGLGLTFAGARETLRILALVAGAAGAASAILGGYALMRFRSARLALSILALPLLVGGLAVSGLVSALVIAGVVMLWLQPTTSWFAGETPPEPRPSRGGRARDPQPVAGTPPSEQEHKRLWPPAGTTTGTTTGAPGSEAPSRPPGMAWPPARPGDQAVQTGQAGQPVATAPAVRPDQRPSTRPSSLQAACLVTWITCGVVALVLAATALVLVAVPEAVFEQLQRQDPDLLRGGMSQEELRRLTLAGCALGVLWSAAASVFAVAAYQGRRWGWLALVVSSVVSAVTSLVLLVGSLALIVTLAGSAAALGLLLRPESRAWCRPRPEARGSVSP